MSDKAKFWRMITLFLVILIIGSIIAFSPNLGGYSLSGEIKKKDITEAQVTLGDGKSYQLNLVLNALIQNSLTLQDIVSKLSTTTLPVIQK